ncbi:uncharacterized protein Dwil_GK27603 [Drosophila willistoni]|uniref:LRRNT domain-containing protein n=1 Tax=Drosophila willistoni TaxID=7260 RepID=A0A0Q9WRC0_DROWI|nr:uncharacterized protein Dwil_GK27603 [Drosophila willistoni]
MNIRDDYCEDYCANECNKPVVGCKYTKFLDFLKRKRPVEYKAAVKRCSGGIEYPDKCLSCKDDDSQMFIVNCTDSGLTEMPLLPESSSLYYLDMRNNNISTLSKNLRESLISRSNSSLYKLKLFMSVRLTNNALIESKLKS